MHKTITVDGKEMEFTANAATPYRYKQVFKKDMLQILSDPARAEKEGVEVVTELAYVMNKQAEKTNMNSLDYDTFIEWLEGFEPLAFFDCSDEIMSVYADSKATTSTP